jgi:preflagellin peptidase FlaK
MKAITLVAVLFPVAPSFILPQTIPVVGGVTLPIYLSAAGLFSFAILCNTLIISWGLPLALGVANAVRGRFSPAMVVGVPRGLRDMKEDASVVGTSLPGVTSQWEDGEERTVSLLDAYLEWSGRSIKDIVSEGPNPQFEEVDRGANSVGGHGEIHTTDGGYLDHSDDWGAVRFVQETGVEVPPGEVRSMLDTLNSRGDEDMTVWVKLQLPFLVPLVLGTVVSLTLGNVLIAILLSL